TRRSSDLVALAVARGGFVARAFRELEQLGGLGDCLRGTIDLAGVGSQPRALAPELLGALRVRPDGRVLELASHFLEALPLAIVLKETPVTRRRAPRGL